MGGEEKEIWGVGTRTDRDLECHGHIWHRAVEYLGENSRRPGQGRRGSKGRGAGCEASTDGVVDGVIVERIAAETRTRAVENTK
jgi:hypothetical protein